MSNGGDVSEHSELLEEKRDGIAMLTLNRPQSGNALTASLLDSLSETLARLAGDEDVRCVIIRGAGSKAFSLGMDLRAMAVSTPEENQRLISAGGPLRRAIAAIESFPFPVVAMVQGYGAGAACELALSCDIRTGCGQTRMGMPPAKLGIVYPPEGLERFVRKLGLASAQRIFYTGRYFEADELYSMGVVDFLCGDELEGFTMELARRMAANAPLSMKGHKRTFQAISKAQGADLGGEERAAVNEIVIQAMRSADAGEGILAFLQKRPPEFNGS